MDNPRIDNMGTKRWWVNGRRHRTDGPAIEYADGTKLWYINGKQHRTDGPAIEWWDGQMDWYLNDHIYSFDDWLDANTDLTDGEKVMMKLKFA
jgi:hypothetical protein